MEQLFLFILKCFAVCWILSSAKCNKRVERGFCSVRNLPIANGDYTLRSGNSIVKYTCNTGFQLYGSETMVCFGQSWNTDPPMCIANTCQKIKETSVLRIKEEFNGALLKFSCAALYKLEGSAKLLCTGTDWTDKVPVCKEWDPPMSCDLESADICGWYHDETGDVEWRWNTGETPTSRTGPTHDHTLGPGGNGHYMYFETSSPTRTNHKAILSSPLYPAEYSQRRCFSFWYHIHGSGDISDLELFFKPDGAEISGLKPVFLINEDGGDQWYQASIPVTPQDRAFQVVFVATRATSYRSDFAVDDFILGDCKDTLSTLPSNQTTSATISKNRTVTEPTTQQSTTPTTTTTTTVTTLTTITTQKTTPLKISTATTKTAKPTTVKTTIMTTAAPTTTMPKPSTEAATPTLTHALANSSSDTRQTSTVQTLCTKLTSKSDNKTISTSSTLKPIVNPNLSRQDFSKIRIPESKDNTSKIVYIVIGVGLIVIIAGIAAVGIVCYRRRLKRRQLQSGCLSSTNPLYNLMTGDEAAVHFAADMPDENE